MSSVLLPNSKVEYDAVEGGVGAGLLLITLVVSGIVAICIFSCLTNYQESFHTILSVFYFSFNERQQHSKNQRVLLIWKRDVSANKHHCSKFIIASWQSCLSCGSSLLLWMTRFSKKQPRAMTSIRMI